MNRHICIHGHFYQPPRENAWLEDVEAQGSAFPYHDWNERITAECYGPNTASRILDGDGHIVDIINNYSRISFNFGPTLLSWMEKHEPAVYKAILEADTLSQKRFGGHGSAIAQVYNHIIMPLANKRDKVTQIVWGVADFEARFGRKPEGIWLAETAVDTPTLELLADHGIAYTILAPRQAAQARPITEAGDQEPWQDASDGKVDPRRPYLCRLPSGKSIALFFYDGPISQALAFEKLLNNGEALAGRLAGALDTEGNWPHMVHIATDGETYGHHHGKGDMALSYCLHHLESEGIAKVSIYGEFLEKHPPKWEARIWDNSSWSCVHGVERWRSNCGCNSGMHGSWSQEWRQPLREALDWLRDELAIFFEKEGGKLLRDPWKARDAYVSVIMDRSPESVDAFLKKHAKAGPGADPATVRGKILKHMEIQRHALLMYTSCGWFFDEISGIETTQILQYAARAIQLAKEIGGPDLDADFTEKLRDAPSNIAEYENGAWVYENFVKPAAISLLRVGAHHAVTSLFDECGERFDLYCYRGVSLDRDYLEMGRSRLVVGRTRIRSSITYDETEISFAVLHLGDQNLIGGVREFMGGESFGEMRDQIREAFRRNAVPEVIRLIDTHYENHNYSLWHLFHDEQRRIIEEVFQPTLEDSEVALRHLYDRSYPMLNVLKQTRQPIPKVLAATTEFVLNADLRHLLEAEELDMSRIHNLLNEMRAWNVQPSEAELLLVITDRVEALMKHLEEKPNDLHAIEQALNLLSVARSAKVTLDLWTSQNRFFRMAKELLAKKPDGAASAPKPKDGCREKLVALGESLGVKVQ